ncbi:MAG: GFA family protein [Porticoccaceae bacterium]|jgi:hypothetical protein|nr:GFA family protein [Porticoccaceae bacterium]
MAIKGYCLCRTVQYELDGEVGDAVRCYCRSCQCVTGSAFATVAMADANRFRITAGEEALSSFESSPGKRRHFCTSCGSAIYTMLDTDQATYRMRVGGLEDSGSVNVTKHIFVAEKVSWYEINDDLPQFDGWP